jgi:hypothetical protein
VGTPIFREKICQMHKNWKIHRIATPMRHVTILHNHHEATTNIVEHPVYPTYLSIEITTSGQIFSNMM